MSSESTRRQLAPPRTTSIVRLAWWLLWLALALLAVEFVHSVYMKYASLQSPAYAMFLTRRRWLWCHLGGGAVGLLLGALQFATQRWRRWPRLHRWVGRAYLENPGQSVLLLRSASGIARWVGPFGQDQAGKKCTLTPVSAVCRIYSKILVNN
ncbi:hypothetical protein [Xanthomonas sontii]|uniref:Uncharacterized protein n=1 Tax=Xanthomonas sontii TaxID=2650745 RepID=A0A6N7QDZ8_9XANT|nr:hypothetical protein [Xanthomonas sontii]MRH02559.1 hypothetical protein [Xanthomonas sontii]MRH76889.1 hypothetical protein [Xanthomonas sontii]